MMNLWADFGGRHEYLTMYACRISGSQKGDYEPQILPEEFCLLDTTYVVHSVSTTILEKQVTTKFWNES
jgi:hypothetical protein